MTISIYSFDYDGSLSPKKYRNLIIKDNLSLINDIIEENKDRKHIYITIGSARQSQTWDKHNEKLNGNGSCFIEIPSFAEHLNEQPQLKNKVTFVRFLMADVYGNLPPGTSFERFLKSERGMPLHKKKDIAAEILFKIWQDNKYPSQAFNLSQDCKVTLETLRSGLSIDEFFYETGPRLKAEGWAGDLESLYVNRFQTTHAESYYDDSKVNIVYGQMHERAIAIAKEYPRENLEFKFMDDRMDILNDLKGFFLEFPHLIPKNMKLMLYQYEGTPDEEICTIQGTGSIDLDYAKTIQKMTELAKKRPGSDYHEELNLAKSANLLRFLRTMPHDDTFSKVFNQNESEETSSEVKLESVVSAALNGSVNGVPSNSEVKGEPVAEAMNIGTASENDASPTSEVKVEPIAEATNVIGSGITFFGRDDGPDYCKNHGNGALLAS